MTSAETN